MAQGLYFEGAYGILLIQAQRFLCRIERARKRPLTDVMLLLAGAHRRAERSRPGAKHAAHTVTQPCCEESVIVISSFDRGGHRGNATQLVKGDGEHADGACQV